MILEENSQTTVSRVSVNNSKLDLLSVVTTLWLIFYRCSPDLDQSESQYADNHTGWHSEPVRSSGSLFDTFVCEDFCLISAPISSEMIIL